MCVGILKKRLRVDLIPCNRTADTLSYLLWLVLPFEKLCEVQSAKFQELPGELHSLIPIQLTCLVQMIGQEEGCTWKSDKWEKSIKWIVEEFPEWLKALKCAVFDPAYAPDTLFLKI